MGCDSENMSCGNPCREGPKNTAAHETLASKVLNFSEQFFGEVVKTEVEGAVRWSLPCALDVGLPGAIRGPTEPLGCYLLRLFQDGITGPVGATGIQGASGANGNSSYTLSLSAFLVPPVGQMVTANFLFNPALVPGVTLYDAGSGWYLIVARNGTGTLTLQVEELVADPSPTVAANTLFVVSGAAGAPGLIGVSGVLGNPGHQGGLGVTGGIGLAGANGTPLVAKFAGAAPLPHADIGGPIHFPNGTAPNGWQGQIGRCEPGLGWFSGTIGQSWRNWDGVYTGGGVITTQTGIVGSSQSHMVTDSYGNPLGPWTSQVPQITLPNIGTYLVFGSCWARFSADDGGSGSGVITKVLLDGRLFNASTQAPVPGSTCYGYAVTANYDVPMFMAGVVVTTSVNNVVGISVRMDPTSNTGGNSVLLNDLRNAAVVRWGVGAVKAVQIA